MLIISLLLLIIVFVFAFLFLIPKGKEYRIERIAMKKEFKIKKKYQEWYDETYEQLQTLRNENKSIIEAYENEFDTDRFIQKNKNCFETLNISKKTLIDDNTSRFSIYEVNATSKIDSPQNFYTFIEQVNKSDWIVKVNFPIHFEREGNLIRSSFKMRVYKTEQTSSKARVSVDK
jgi:hypothetical protein